MRYALVSDIHANWQAWEAVLADAQKAGVDGIICLGDIVGYGPKPARVLESVYEHSDMFLLGNHDAVICGRFDSDCFNDQAREIIEWTGRQLNESAVDFFNQVPMMILGDTFGLSHAEFAVPERFDYIYDPPEAKESFEAVEQQILFCGHTHFPGTIRMLPDGHPDYRKPQDFKIEEGFRYLVNVGSVGDPRNGDIRASYVIYDLDKEAVDFRNVPFDIEAYRRDIQQAGIPTQPILFDYADEKEAPKEAAAHVREFHVDEEAVARATAAESAAGLQRIDLSGLESRKKVVVSAGSIGADGVSFRSTSAGKYHKSDRKRLAVTLAICVISLLLVGAGLTWSTLKQRKKAADPELAKSDPNAPQPPGTPEEVEPIPPMNPIDERLLEGLAVHWNFNGEGVNTVFDDSGAGLDALLTDGTRIPGISGTGIEFNGTSTSVKVEDAVQPALGHNQPWVVSFWYRFEAPGGMLFSKLKDHRQKGYYAMISNAGIFEWRHVHAYETKRLKFTTTQDIRTVAPAGDWMHMLLQYDGSMKAAGAAFYVNGEKQEVNVSRDALSGDADNPFPFMLGSNPSGQHKLKGGMDEFRIYHRNLSEAEIQRLADRSRFENPSKALAPASAVDEEIVTAVRLKFAAAKQEILAPAYDRTAAVRTLNKLAEDVAGTTLEGDIQRVIQDVNAQIDKGKTDTMRQLEVAAAPLVKAGDPAAAAKIYADYKGAFDTETASLRNAKAGTLRTQAAEIARKEKSMHEKLNRHLRETFAEDLLSQRFDVVFDARQDVVAEYPGLAATAQFKALAKEVDLLLQGRDKILSTFIAGSEMELELRKGKSMFKVVEVKDGVVLVHPQDKGRFTSRTVPIQVSMLSSREQFSRLGEAQAPGASFFKGLVLASSSNPQNAASFLKRANVPLANTIHSRLAQVREDRADDAVDARLSDFRNRLKVPADVTAKSEIRKAVLSRNFSATALKTFRQEAKNYRKSYGKSDAFKPHEGLISAIEALRIPAHMMPFVGAVGVVSMESNKFKRSGDAFGAENRGSKRGVGIVGGKPVSVSTEGGKLFSFNGSNHIAFENGLGLKGNGDFSITFWARPEQKPGERTLVSMGIFKNDPSFFMLGAKNDLFMMGVGNKLTTHGKVKLNTWQYHVILHEGKTTTWFVDNQKVGTFELELNLSEYVMLGAQKDPENVVKKSFVGQMKDLHVYKRVLRDDELKKIEAMVLSSQ